MADALSDIATFTSAFSQFAGSIKQLHDTRVQAESEAKAMEINQANYQLLQRWNLPVGDPNRLSLDPNDASYWRTALESQQAEVESYLSSVKDPAIQAGVRKQLEGSTQQFALAVSNKLAEAELVNTQESRLSTYRMLLNTGNITDALSYAETKIKGDQLLSPEKMDEFWTKEVVPVEGALLASQIKAGKIGVYKEERTESAVEGTGESIEHSQIVQVGERDRTLNEAIAVASQMGGVEADKKRAALSYLYAEQAQNSKEANTEYEYTVKAALAQGYAGPAAAQMAALVRKWGGKVDNKTMLEIIAAGYEVDKRTAIADMNGVVTSIVSLAGFDVDKNGNVIAGSKKISATMGGQLLKQYYDKFRPLVASNDILESEMEAGATKIRNLIAETDEDKRGVFDAHFAPALLKYKAGIITGGELANVVFTYGGDLGHNDLATMLDKLEQGGYNVKQVRDLVTDEGMRQFTTTMLEDPALIGAANQKELKAWIEGKPADPTVVRAMVDVYNKWINMASTGTRMTTQQAQDYLAESIAKAVAESDVHKTVKQKLSDPATVKQVGTVYQKASAGEPDIYGVKNTPQLTNTAYEMVAPLAQDTLFAIEKRAGTPIKENYDAVPVIAPDGTMFLTVFDPDNPKDGWQKTIYKVAGDEGGVHLTEMTSGNSDVVGPTALQKAIKAGDFSAFGVKGTKHVIDYLDSTVKRKEREEEITATVQSAVAPVSDEEKAAKREATPVQGIFGGGVK